MTEEWKDIAGYEGQYQVSSLGRIKSLIRIHIPRERIMAKHQWHGYEVIWLRRPNEHRKYKVHRLVAIAFLQKIEGKDVVNHKNKNRVDNSVDNLEWMTHEENCHHRDNYVRNDEPF